VLPPDWLSSPPTPGPHDIRIHTPPTPPTATPADATALLASVEQAGWSLLQCEFRHTRFDPPTPSQPARSRFNFAAHLTRTNPLERAVIEGPIDITWNLPPDPASHPAPTHIDARNLVLLRRPGPAPFETILAEPVAPQRLSLSIDPLIAADLDQDGFPEILLVARNLAYHRQPDGSHRPRPISPALTEPVSAAVLGRFDSDAHPDLLCVTRRSLELLPGLPDGRFAPSFQRAWSAPPDLHTAMTLTAGDIDGDGDLDVFLGQYKEPYEGGSSPTPFFAANDGYPAFLLINDGTGRFTDATPASGLGPKRHRRLYAATFADLDDDRRLDLIAVSDFAGLDLFRNEGGGRFSDVTSRWVRNPHAFGMALSLSDFNADGRLDLLMIGMPSPTVDRLEHLGLRRPDSHQDASRRTDMTRGNRLYLGGPGGSFDEGSLGDSIARSGWSWGCAAADFDNDGHVDAAIVNGMESRTTVRDYEAEYWLHDQHVGTSEDRPAAYLYFRNKFARTRERGQSYGGYEKNRLYLNLAGTRFLEVGHLFGLALEQDSRNLLAEDLDADGRVDCVVVTFEKWPDPKPTLRLLRNNLPGAGRWIGFRCPDAPPGTRVTLRAGTRSWTRVIVAGDSYRSQHSASVHFGIGGVERVDEAAVLVPDGRRWTGTNLAPDRYYRIRTGPDGTLSGTE
jgi:hypothetical protein